ncbi:nickel import ATP-binding protein NikE [Salmonella enterica subsp. enterica serovar Choleraesuis]|nr:nickel import ATP-binding protein NikE [Salmonella enterica subsp. enterica serovar Choleraesuis]
MNLLTVDSLTQRYSRSAAHLALDNVSLEINAGESIALVGRSGCGKSTLARLLTGLERPESGCVRYRNHPVTELDRQQRNAFRRDVQLVFQDAFSAVNPRLRIGDIISEPLRHLTSLSRPERQEKAARMLEAVGLDASLLTQRPAQLSGGQLQRVSLARALVIEPRLIILDEAVSSLDVVIQAQILELLRKLRQQLGVAFLFITHDLRLVGSFCQRVIVMDNGKIAEDVAINGDLRLTSPAGQALRRAILPALPVARPMLATA